ncbi:unnamed protein product [Rotaria sordida]|uniref:G-protein coupled receptors family 1 profile domain-containing protein n=1 Tax=Rotaria sordida TaxID=392033 RepID=A0A818KTA0_9BILA|nr:unnamed protein product [Rotaria sordida]CAF0861417.1 unnamed protein product [Rotaria sordida]CAF3533927.1 unnamed protein product [Rotaria sordida]CAF3561463.1 unnamed protein product [Rotaria sordida]
MSSSILTNIQNQLSLYGYPICLILGNIGNIFIVMVFIRQRQNACTIYILTSAIMSDLYVNFNGFVQLFPFYYRDETPFEFFLCKMRPYLTNILGQLVHLKEQNGLFFFAIIFWLINCIHIPIMQTIINGRCTTYGIYTTIYSIYSIIFVGLIPPTLLIIFGNLTYHNMKKRHIRIQPISNNINDQHISIQRRDKDLFIIVLCEALLYIITTTLFPLMLLESMISQYIIINKSVQHLQIESFLFSIVFILLLLNSSLPFYIYLIGSKSFRRDFKQLFIDGYQKLKRQQIVQIALRI